MHDVPRKCSSIEDCLKQLDDYARKEPAKTAATAFLTGVAINVLPIGGILALLTRLSIRLLKPALIVLGTVKAYELWETCNSKKTSTTTSPNGNP